MSVCLFFFRLRDKTEKSTGVLKCLRTNMCYWNIQEGYTKKISNKLYPHRHRNHLNGKPREDIRFSWTSRKTTSASLWRQVRILAFCFPHRRGWTWIHFPWVFWGMLAKRFTINYMPFILKDLMQHPPHSCLLSLSSYLLSLSPNSSSI